ncbi:unnamed protein product [Ectocarpus sp. CCAP 1310/34]|nr:unnamed protein product [Ectocarpus sp. CCAP 1310/34]
MKWNLTSMRFVRLELRGFCTNAMAPRLSSRTRILLPLASGAANESTARTNNASLTFSPAAMYSASVEDKDTIRCVLLPWLTTEQCTLNQALTQDGQNPGLSLLAASQTKNKEALTQDGVTRVIRELQKSFDFVVCDSPAGIESGARHAMYLADEAVIVTNPEVSSCRDSDKMVGFIASMSRRAEAGQAPVRQTLLVTRYDPARAECNEMLTLADIQELLGLEVLGFFPVSKAVLTATNLGQPVIVSEGDDAATAYKDAVDRFLGKTVDLKFGQPKPAGLLKRMFGSSS